MAFLLDLVAWVLLLGGSFFAVAGGIGAMRLPDVFTRLHATGMTDTMGAALILTGLMFQTSLSFTTVKLVLILVFLWVTSPVASHAVSHAALRGGVEPIIHGDGDGR
jgi:multicomponent Na+:H+ antiporter subunit G